MTQIVSSISGIEIYAPSAGNAPTNSADVSAIASGYQVVSSTATQLYAGTAYLTSVNSAQISAARAGNAANASMANSAYYDGTGRLISALPDSAAVSAIASAYQVVTATGSAAVGYGLGAETAVSSINGSALFPYGFSALSGNSSNWNSTRTAVTANSANWNSVYNTVNSNSASWSGSTGGGSVVSPSGTIVVNGSSIEGTNSAVLTASGEGFETVFFPQNTHLGPQMMMLAGGSVPGTGATLMMPMHQAAYADFQVILSGNGDTGLASASGTIPMGTLTASVPLEDITGAISASANQWFDLDNDTLTARKDGGILVTGVGELAWNSALTGVSATVANNSASWGQGGVDSATVSSIASSYAESAASGVTDTVSSNSATWGQGGPVTSTASAAASAYTSTGTSVSSFTGVSSVNGSALLARNILPDAQQANGNARFHFMPTASPWGASEYTGVLSPLQYATGAALAMKQTNNYGAYYKGNEWFISDVGSNTAANGVVRAELHRTRGIHLYGSSLNSATGFHLNGSGVDGKSGGSSWQYGPSEYNMLTAVNDTVYYNSASWGQGGVDSATVSSIASSYAQDVSAAVSGTVDTVSAQSANWGGSALALSAGPGVKLEKVGDTLVAGLDETVLWSGSSAASVNTVFTLGESYTNFERIRLSLARSTTQMPTIQEFYVGGASTTLNCMIPIVDSGAGSTMYIDGVDFGLTDQSTFTVRGITRKKLASTALTTESDKPLTLFKIVGINRTAGV